MAHSFYAFLAPPIVVGVLLTCQSLDPEYKTTVFFSYVFPRKKHCLIFGSVRYVLIGSLVACVLFLRHPSQHICYSVPKPVTFISPLAQSLLKLHLHPPFLQLCLQMSKQLFHPFIFSFPLLFCATLGLDDRADGWWYGEHGWGDEGDGPSLLLA